MVLRVVQEFSVADRRFRKVDLVREVVLWRVPEIFARPEVIWSRFWGAARGVAEAGMIFSVDDRIVFHLCIFSNDLHIGILNFVRMKISAVICRVLILRLGSTCFGKKSRVALICEKILDLVIDSYLLRVSWG